MRRPLRLVALLAVAASLLAAGGAALFVLRVRSSGLPQRAGAVRGPGLAASVEVRWDRWGVPHVRAQRMLDLAWAVGWLHANDRLGQMDVARRAVAGRLSEVFGPPALDVDREHRILRLRRVAEVQWEAAGAEAREWLLAYAAGVNAWIQQRGADLPPQFRLLGYRPEPWTPVDSLSVVAMLYRGLSFVSGRPEELRYVWLRDLGLEPARELAGLPDLEVPEEILRRAEEERERRRAETSAAGGAAGGPVPDPASGGGSNNWALGASRTSSGAPIVANDPHLGFALPGIWYQVHLEAPGFQVAGVTLPGLPGVVIGQTEHLAWALTNNMLDDHDIYFEELDAAGERVRRGEAWVPLERGRSVIEVRGGEPVELELLATDRGPLLPADEKLGLPPRSLSWVAYWPSDPVLPFQRLQRATRVDELTALLDEYAGPAQNLVAADRDGGLLWTVLGRVPERRGWDGRMPAPGWDPRFGWDGLRPRPLNPTVLRPPDDLLVTANQDNVPPDFPLPHSQDPDGPFRARRIHELLLASTGWTAADAAAVQTDVKDLYADRILHLLGLEQPAPAPPDPAARALAAWDRRMEARGASALWVLFERELQRGIFADEERRHHLPEFPIIFQRNRLEALLARRMSETWFDDVETEAVEDRQTIVNGALARAWELGARRFGGDLARWDYRDLHTLTLEHPLSRAPIIGGWFRRGPIPVPGSATTVAAFGGPWDGDRLPVRWGPSMRFVADLADPDCSLWVLPAGQSGHPADPHYDDQTEDYLAGRMHPVLWSEAAVAAGTGEVLVLQP